MPARGKAALYQGYKWIRPEKRYALYVRDELQCVWCSTAPLRLSLDHLVPWCRGGSNHQTNLVTCCFACNARKGNHSLQEWVLTIPKPEEVLARVERQRFLPINIHVGRELYAAQKKKPWRQPPAMECRMVQDAMERLGYTGEDFQEEDISDTADVSFI